MDDLFAVNFLTHNKQRAKKSWRLSGSQIAKIFDLS